MAERIKEKRIELGLTQEELGEKLGLQKSAIAKYENGRVENIKRSVIAEMARLFNCSPAYLMGWDEPASQKDDIEITEDIRRIARAHKQMSDKDRQRLMTIVTTSFDEYFSDDFFDIFFFVICWSNYKAVRHLFYVLVIIMVEFNLLFKRAKLQNKMHIIKFICYFLLLAFHQLMEKSKSMSNFFAFILYFFATKLSVSIPL